MKDFPEAEARDAAERYCEHMSDSYRKEAGHGVELGYLNGYKAAWTKAQGEFEQYKSDHNGDDENDPSFNNSRLKKQFIDDGPFGCMKKERCPTCGYVLRTKNASPHGRTGYTNGCCCQVCRDARAEYMRGYRKRIAKANN